jgi:hypothetical protein
MSQSRIRIAATTVKMGNKPPVGFRQTDVKW